LPIVAIGAIVRATSNGGKDMETETLEQRVLEDPATPFWLRDLILETRKRDPVDVLAAIETMLAVAEDRVHS
jgi:hypothetical protein